MTKNVMSFLAVGILMLGCKDDPTVPPTPRTPESVVNGAYILNEGSFGVPNSARLSLYDIDLNVAHHDVFESANNGLHLGSTGDDMKFHNGMAYIVMSGSENIVVMQLSNHRLVRSATYGGDTPHDIVIDSVNDKAYVSRLFKNSLLVINLATLVVFDSINVGANPQGMVLSGSRLFVCNSGFGAGTTVTVVDTDGDSVVTTLNVSDGPAGGAIAPDGMVWIVCSGNAFGVPPTNGKVFIINPQTLSIEDSVSFAEGLWGSVTMAGNGFAYLIGVSSGSFYGGPIHRIEISSKSVTSSFITRTFYGMGYDESSGLLYLADAKEFQSNGEVVVYSADGDSLRAFPSQRGPSIIMFKH